MTDRPLLIIPARSRRPPAVAAAFAVPPPSHVGPTGDRGLRAALERMREVWRSAPDSRPVVIGGGGTLAMDMAVANLIEPGDRALVVSTGYFSARMAEMLRRAGADVTVVGAEPGDAPTVGAVGEALAELRLAARSRRSSSPTLTPPPASSSTPNRSPASLARPEPWRSSTASAPPPASASRWRSGTPIST